MPEDGSKDMYFFGERSDIIMEAVQFDGSLCDRTVPNNNCATDTEMKKYLSELLIRLWVREDEVNFNYADYHEPPI